MKERYKVQILLKLAHLIIENELKQVISYLVVVLNVSNNVAVCSWPEADNGWAKRITEN